MEGTVASYSGTTLVMNITTTARLGHMEILVDSFTPDDYIETGFVKVICPCAVQRCDRERARARDGARRVECCKARDRVIQGYGCLDCRSINAGSKASAP